MAIGPGGVTSEARFAFTVLAPWYRKWWAIASYVVLLIAAAWQLVRWRTHALKQEKEKLEKKVEKRTDQLREKEIALRQAFNELKDAQDQVIQLEKLSAQMNPHFVFNALNTIQSFIYSDDKKSATKYLGKFSDLMRKVLDNSSKSKVALAREIELLGLYLDLERSRFGEDFNARIEIEPGLNLEEIEVPPMLVQPYVENAIKHGLLHKTGEKVLVTTIFRPSADLNKIEIRITDNGIGRMKSEEINRSRVNHNPFATRANEKRIEIFNRHHHTSVKIEVIDDWHADDSPAGTTVSITIPV
jgi:LytS/YehU family sensor histidine kinase